jgi:hypothetical protein
LRRLGLITPFVVLDAAVDVTSPVPGCSTIPAARTPLFKGGPEVYQLSAILVDLGFEFAEFFKLGLVSPHGSGHRVSLP